MRFWDSSAIVPMLRFERTTDSIQHLYESDKRMAVWFFTGNEVLSSLCRLRRERLLSPDDFPRAKEKLSSLTSDWFEIQDHYRVRQRAERLLEVHPLTSADALQLAAALVLVDEKTQGFSFVSLDDRLVEAAAKEGFSLPDFEK